MSRFEDPIQFDVKKKVGNGEIVYFDLMEISQGGPQVGSLSINGKIVEGRYGGPIIYDDRYVYAPAHVKKFLGTGFKLSRINMTTLGVEYLSKIKDLIFLDKLEDNRIYFFEDISKTIQRHFDL